MHGIFNYITKILILQSSFKIVMLILYSRNLIISPTSASYCNSKKFAIRLVVGAWCLLAFVLVTAYQSVLVSFIMSSGIEPPLVKSLSDLLSKPNVHVSVEKGKGIDNSLMVIAFFI